ncbi:hypothetical protein MA20_38775 [Bradyrhizobium japonicum]|uniref:Uncharacterized protein n=1 Tax=Bradyrhizobium japonicum TaxID=375 RepID=A0A0A3XJP3_BRAJP|nr:hypothetical protein MA20_38775 [Bradyrhizobium japonicum]
MSDARWTDVDKDLDYALMHHGMAIRLFEAAGFDAPDLDGYEFESVHARDGSGLYVDRERASRVLAIRRGMAQGSHRPPIEAADGGERQAGILRR